MAKLGKDLKPGDRLSLTGEQVLEVVVGPDVRVLTTRQRKTFGYGQVVYLQGA